MNIIITLFQLIVSFSIALLLLYALGKMENSKVINNADERERSCKSEQFNQLNKLDTGRYHLRFSVNLYNEYGEIYEECILLHLNNGAIISFKNIESYKEFVEQMQGLECEIKENLERRK